MDAPFDVEMSSSSQDEADHPAQSISFFEFIPTSTSPTQRLEQPKRSKVKVKIDLLPQEILSMVFNGLEAPGHLFMTSKYFNGE